MGRRAQGPRSAVAAVSLAALLLLTGSLHFLTPDAFTAIVPGLLGAPLAWVYASGAAELGCAAALVVRRSRRVAGWATAALFVLVFPANVQMAVDALHGHGSVVIALLRLPLQVPLIAWALYVAWWVPGPPTGPRPA